MTKPNDIEVSAHLADPERAAMVMKFMDRSTRATGELMIAGNVSSERSARIPSSRRGKLGTRSSRPPRVYFLPKSDE